MVSSRSVYKPLLLYSTKQSVQYAVLLLLYSGMLKVKANMWE